MSLRVGGLFSGVGALETAAADVFGATHAWFAEHEPPTCRTPRPRNAPAHVLRHRFPGIPNLGDVTAIDWRDVPSAEILTGGYPCASQSVAGLQLGQNDDRWLWPTYRAAIRALRPRWAVGENVAGHVNMDLWQVIADLQRDGYAVAWTTIAAADTGACHERRRVFWLAWPEEAGAPAAHGDPFAWLSPPGWGVDDLLGWSPTRRWAYQGAAYQGVAYQGAAYQSDGVCGVDLRPVAELLLTPTAQLAINGGSQHPDKRRSGGHGPTLADQIEHLLPTPRASDAAKGGPNQRGSAGDWLLPAAVQPARFGQYAAAVARHEAMLGRPAPDPTGPYGRNGEQRLCHRFVEWMMCWPTGWVTDVPGVTRNDAIKACGNGVVIHQARAAIRRLRSTAPDTERC